MITASVWIELPPEYYIAEVSRSFPNATFRLLSGVRTGERAVELGEVVADQPQAAGEAILEHPAVGAYEQLELTAERSLAKYETTQTGLYEFIEDSSLPPEFPIEAEDGWYKLDFTGTREEFDRLRTGLEGMDRRYELHSLVESEETETETLLTSRQREVLDTAMRAGYFEVPRECTLAELAARLGIDKSTASTILRRGENRILNWFLTGVHEQRLGE